jgi:Fur family ferric uptake transcriptional regulator
MGIKRNTKSVDLLLDEFEKELVSVSALELVRRLKSRLNKATVYRVLDKLEDDGVLHSFIGMNAVRWYAKCVGCSVEKHIDRHPHFQCVLCGIAECLPTIVQVQIIPNRKVLFSQTLIYGECEQCTTSLSEPE